LKQRGGRAPASDRDLRQRGCARNCVRCRAAARRALLHRLLRRPGFHRIADGTGIAARTRWVPPAALHVDHGLHADSVHWAQAARAQARRLGIACEVLRVRIRRGAGESLEALAREARYAALTARSRRRSS